MKKSDFLLKSPTKEDKIDWNCFQRDFLGGFIKWQIKLTQLVSLPQVVTHQA
jgi:hypothetical protein